MFVYCFNNPVNRIDPSGQSPIVPILIAIVVVVCLVNNVYNAITYEKSDGESDLTPDSYNYEKPSRQEKLDYVKQQTGDEHYNVNAWRYYSEYSLHEYGWYVTKWAYKKDYWIFSEASEHFRDATVLPHNWDPVWPVNVFVALWGITGI